MRLPEICVRRPVFTTMLILLPTVLGILGYMRMGVDLYPNVDLPVIIVTINRPGASVEEMETGVTKVVEEAVNTLSGIDELRSTTKEGISVTTVAFVLEKNRDVAQQEVQSKINTIISQLPAGTQSPIIDKFDLDARPVLQIAVAGERSLREVTEIADKQISEALSSLDGVGSVTLIGGRRRAVNVTIDTKKLEAFGISIEQVRQALASQNLELPGGRVDQNTRELVLRTMGRIVEVRQFADVIVTNVNGQPVRLRDLGDGVKCVEDSWEEPRTLARLDGSNAVFLSVQKQSGTNTVEVIDTVKAKLKEMDQSLTAEGKGDIHTKVIRDDSRFIKASLHEVKKHLILGSLLVSVTILLFLRDWRTMVIASLSIPTSLIATFAVLQAMHFTINNITMLAILLAVGIVIDDAVVVHENIFRWMEEKGMSAWDAALGATQEIGLAVMATTFSLVVIFLPIAFMSGRVGRFFSSFGIASAVAITMSLFVSFTMTPMLCSRFLRLSEKAKEAQKHGKSHHSGGAYGWLAEKPYLWCLQWSMRHRWMIIILTFLVFLTILPLPVGKWIAKGDPQREKSLAWLNYPGLFGVVGFDFIPRDDTSDFEISITTPEGWTLDRADVLLHQIEERLKKEVPGVLNVLTSAGDTSGRTARGEGAVTQASIYVRIVDLEERNFPLTDCLKAAHKVMRDYPDLRVSVQYTGSMGGGPNNDLEMVIIGPDLDRLTAYSEQMLAKLRANPNLADVDTTMSLRKPELRVSVDRDRASDLGVSIQTIASTLRTMVGGQIVTDYKDPANGENYDVWLRAQGADRGDPAAVWNLTIPSTKAGLVRLINVADLNEARGPAQIDRLSRLRKISIVANLSGIPMNVAIGKFQEAFAELKTPPDYTIVSTGRAKTQAESIGAFFMAFLFSLVFMYMILAAQFESFVHPITILLAVPLTIPFALISLLALGQPLTIFSLLGLFLLFGIVKKNGILQVDYTNVLRHQAAADSNVVPSLYRETSISAEPQGWYQRWVGNLRPEKKVRLWAIMESNRVRLRPILMTTCMLIAGMVPIALGMGPGAAARASMAKVIVGGQALSLLLSLLVTPVAYSLFDDLTKRRNKP